MKKRDMILLLHQRAETVTDLLSRKKERLNELALFAGAGGGILGGKLVGFRTVCAVEIERHARNVLLARQNERFLDAFPVWDDVTTFDGKPWRGSVDVVSAGFPCQDVSIGRAMWGREGINGSKSKLWRQVPRIADEIQAPLVWAENSPELRRKGLLEIAREFARIGYVSRWVTLGAESVGLNHRRKRLWFLAIRECQGRKGYFWDVANQAGREIKAGSVADVDFRSCSFCGYIFESDAFGCPNCCAEGCGHSRDQGSGLLPRICGMDHGMADRVDRLRAIGNGQVPAVAALAWSLLTESY